MINKTVITISVLILICSCKSKDPDCTNKPPKVVLDVPENLKKYVPYDGKDTVYFQITDTSGKILDTVQIVGQGNVYEEKLYDVIKTSCPQTRYSKTCSIKFVDENQVCHFTYKYLPYSTTMDFEITFQDSIFINYNDMVVENQNWPKTKDVLTICGKDYYIVNKIPSVRYDPHNYGNVATKGYGLIDRHGQLIKIVSGHIIYNLL